jgi:hypothetical protein
MKKFIKVTIGILMTGSLVLSPVFALANNGKGIEKKEIKTTANIKVNKEKEEDRENVKGSCLKAWGHLFAFGWLKHNESITIGSDCVLPFGIAKKIGGNSSTTPDTTAPIITNISTTTRIGEAVITWNTNENADSTIYFGNNNPVNLNGSSTPIVHKNDLTKNHKITLNGLSAGTTYYAVVTSKDKAGNNSTSSQISFTTKTPDTSSDNQSPVISNIVSVVSTSTIKVGWKTNEFATGKVYYSINTPVSTTSSAFVESAALDTNHMLIVNGLSPVTVYHLIIESKDGANNKTESAEFLLTTLSL